MSYVVIEIGCLECQEPTTASQFDERPDMKLYLRRRFSEGQGIPEDRVKVWDTEAKDWTSISSRS